MDVFCKSTRRSSTQRRRPRDASGRSGGPCQEATLRRHQPIWTTSSTQWGSIVAGDRADTATASGRFPRLYRSPTISRSTGYWRRTAPDYAFSPGSVTRTTRTAYASGSISRSLSRYVGGPAGPFRTATRMVGWDCGCEASSRIRVCCPRGVPGFRLMLVQRALTRGTPLGVTTIGLAKRGLILSPCLLSHECRSDVTTGIAGRRAWIVLGEEGWVAAA